MNSFPERVLLRVFVCAGETRGHAAEQIAAWAGDERPPQRSDRGRQRDGVSTAGRREPLRERFLRPLAELVDLRDAVHAADRAHRRARLDPPALAFQIIHAILLERDRRMAALLRAPVQSPSSQM